MRIAVAVGLVALVVIGTGCSDDEVAPAPTSAPSATTASPAASISTTTASAAPTTAVPAPAIEVSAAYRQGLARVDDGWIFTTNKALYRTDDDLVRVAEVTDAIPAELAAEGFDHIGDGDVADGVLYLPLEQGDYERGEQRMLLADPVTLEITDHVAVPQSHNAWVSVADGVAYSMSGFSDDSVLRYDVVTWEPLEPIELSATVERVQGGDVLGGAIWLATDDDADGIYRVDLTTGGVTRVGALAPVEGEGEGIDATDLPTGQLHALSVDPAQAPVWFQSFALEG